MGEKAFSKLQWGKEATGAHGTAVPADTLLLAGAHPPVLPDEQLTFIEDDAGVRARSVRAPRSDNKLVEDSLVFEDAYFQLLPVLFSMGIKGNVTASEQNASQADWKRVFTPSMTATNTPDSGTIELGDDTQAYEREYMMIKRLNIAGVIAQDGQASKVGITAEYFARQNTKTTFTGAVSIPVTEEMNAKLCRFYVDTAFADLGSSEKTGLLRSFDIDIITGLHHKSHGGENKYYDIHGEGDIEVITTLILEGNSDAVAIYDAWKARTLAFLQFNLSGQQIGSGDNQNMTLGVGGYWESVIALNEQVNGNNLHQALHHGTYDLTGAQILALEVTTNVASI